MRLGRERPRKRRNAGLTQQRLAWASMRLGRERPRKREELCDRIAEAAASMRLGRERPRKLSLPAVSIPIVVGLQ